MAILMISLGLSLILSAYTFDGRPRITEEEITSLGLDCDKEDYSCEGNRPPKTCECDPQCALYGDCCFDSPHRKNMSKTRHGIECQWYFIVNKCPRDWDDDKTREYCERDPPNPPTSFTELISEAPLASNRSGLSYKNLYCAKCNGDTENLILWTIMIVCSSPTPDGLTLDKLRYNRRISKWGFWRTPGNNQSFIPCHVTSIPFYGDELLQPRSCKPAVDKCAPGWTDVSVKEKCESYQGAMRASSPEIIYRNIHCAFCNGADLKGTDCDVTFGFGGGLGPTNFVKMFTFRPSGYKSSRCKKGMVYDPFKEMCRNLTCLPFQKMRNGKCV